MKKTKIIKRLKQATDFLNSPPLTTRHWADNSFYLLYRDKWTKALSDAMDALSQHRPAKKKTVKYLIQLEDFLFDMSASEECTDEDYEKWSPALLDAADKLSKI